MKSIFWVASTIIALGLLPFQAAPISELPASQTCGIGEGRLTLDKVTHRYLGCAPNDSPKKRDSDDRSRRWFSPPKSNQAEPPIKQINSKDRRSEYTYRDFESCRPGFEVPTGCTSNPDIQACKDGSYPIIRSIYDSNSKFVRAFRRCPDEPNERPLEGKIADERTLKEKIVVSLEEFREFPIRPSRISSDPQHFSLRNGYTHFWASKVQQKFSLNVDGSNVKIKAIPVQWIWKYGDGTTRRLNYPGEPAPEHTLHDETNTSHVYKETGKFQVVVTTLYRGEFSVDGGPWEPIPGQASVPSEPSVMDVWRTKKELIATD